MLQDSLAPATINAYRNALKHYQIFHMTFHTSESILPVSVEKLAQFIAVCHRKGLKSSTITTYLSAIAYIHNIRGYPNPGEAFLIQKILHGLRRNSSPDKRLPITLDILQKLIQALPQHCEDLYIRSVFKAMFLAAFFGLLRVSEIAVTRSSPQHALLRQNVQVQFLGSKPHLLLLHLTSYKHSQGNMATVPLQCNPLKSLCPVKALYKIYSSSTTQGPLFRYACLCPITATGFRTMLRRCVLSCNLDPVRYTAHSLRIGGATYAHSTNVSNEQLKKLGRWKSSAFLKYIRPNPLHAPASSKQ